MRAALPMTRGEVGQAQLVAGRIVEARAEEARLERAEDRAFNRFFFGLGPSATVRKARSRAIAAHHRTCAAESAAWTFMRVKGLHDLDLDGFLERFGS